MSEKCRKNVEKLSRGAANTIFGHFLDKFCLFSRCFCLVTLSNARPLQVQGKEVHQGKQTLLPLFSTLALEAGENEPTGLDGLLGFNFFHHLSFPPLPRFWISIFGMELGGSSHAIYLLDFHFWQRAASLTAMPRPDVYLACFTCLPSVESAFSQVLCLFLSLVAASSA